MKNIVVVCLFMGLGSCGYEGYDTDHSSSTCAVTEEISVVIEDSDDVIIEVQDTVVAPTPEPSGIIKGDYILAPLYPQPEPYVADRIPYCKDVMNDNNIYPCRAYILTKEKTC